MNLLSYIIASWGHLVLAASSCSSSAGTFSANGCADEVRNTLIHIAQALIFAGGMFYMVTKLWTGQGQRAIEYIFEGLLIAIGIPFIMQLLTT